MSEKAKPLPQVVGENVRRLRGEFTMEQLANEGRAYGLNWSTGSVGAIEKGNFKPTIETLAILTQALGSLGLREGNPQEQPQLMDLLQSESSIALSPILETNSDYIEGWLKGDTLDAWINQEFLRRSQQRADSESKRIASLTLPKGWIIDTGRFPPPSPVELRLAKRAKIDPYELQVWAHHLWDTSIENMRDEIAGENATAQKKGRVSRKLMDSLVSAMRSSNGDG